MRPTGWRPIRRQKYSAYLEFCAAIFGAAGQLGPPAGRSILPRPGLSTGAPSRGFGESCDEIIDRFKWQIDDPVPRSKSVPALAAGNLGAAGWGRAARVPASGHPRQRRAD